jgi:ubiquitin-conjugating enzyme E2 J2
MLEKSPTLGSIETSDTDKRQFAFRSHEFNLKNKTFCELFPDQADKSRKITEMHKIQTSQKLKGVNGANGGGTANGDNQVRKRQIPI